MKMRIGFIGLMGLMLALTAGAGEQSGVTNNYRNSSRLTFDTSSKIADEDGAWTLNNATLGKLANGTATVQGTNLTDPVVASVYSFRGANYALMTNTSWGGVVLIGTNQSGSALGLSTNALAASQQGGTDYPILWWLTQHGGGGQYVLTSPGGGALNGNYGLTNATGWQFGSTGPYHDEFYLQYDDDPASALFGSGFHVTNSPFGQSKVLSFMSRYLKNGVVHVNDNADNPWKFSLRSEVVSTNSGEANLVIYSAGPTIAATTNAPWFISSSPTWAATVEVGRFLTNGFKTPNLTVSGAATAATVVGTSGLYGPGTGITNLPASATTNWFVPFSAATINGGIFRVDGYNASAPGVSGSTGGADGLRNNGGSDFGNWYVPVPWHVTNLTLISQCYNNSGLQSAWTNVVKAVYISADLNQVVASTSNSFVYTPASLITNWAVTVSWPATNVPKGIEIAQSAATNTAGWRVYLGPMQFQAH